MTSHDVHLCTRNTQFVVPQSKSASWGHRARNYKTHLTSLSIFPVEKNDDDDDDDDDDDGDDDSKMMYLLVRL